MQSPLEKKEKKSKSVDNLNTYANDQFVEKESNNRLSQNFINSKKCKSLDVLNEVEVIDSMENNNTSNENIQDNKAIKKETNTLNDNDNKVDEKEKTKEHDIFSNLFSEIFKKSEIGRDNSVSSNNSINSNNSSIDYRKKDIIKKALSVVKEEQESVDKISIKDIVEDNSKIIREGSKNSLSVVIKNADLVDKDTNLTPKEFANMLFQMEETEYEGKPISLILTETDRFHEKTLKYFIKNFDFRNVEIDEALRILCNKIVITGETQQIDRILAQFSKHFFKSNPLRQEIFVNEDVTHSIVYSLVLLNTDLHIVYNDNPNKKMTKKEFLKNTMTLLESMAKFESVPPKPSQIKRKSAFIPSTKAYDSPPLEYAHFNTSSLPRNFSEYQESKQKRWKRQMEQLLGELYNSIKSRKILQKTAGGIDDSSSAHSVEPPSSIVNGQNGDTKIQSLFGSSDKSSLSSMKGLINKGKIRKGKEANLYRSLPTLNASDTASYNSFNDNKSFDKISLFTKSTNILNMNNKSLTANIVQKGALSRKHYLEPGKQRARDRRWSKSHCALFVDPELSSQGVCELRIWLESTSTSALKKKSTTNKDFDNLFEMTANEEDIESQNLPYLNHNYHEILPIAHSVTSVVKNYTSFNYTTRKNVFSLKLSNGSTYLFEAADEDAMKTWVNALNFWAARKSKEPLRGAMGNMEYGWNQVEKPEKPKSNSVEEIEEPIQVYDPFDDTFEVNSIRSFSSFNNQEKTSRPNSIHSGCSGRNRSNSNVSRNEISSFTESNSIDNTKDERKPRSFIKIKAFRTSRSASRSTKYKHSIRSVSLNRDTRETSTPTTISDSHSYSFTPRPSQASSQISNQPKSAKVSISSNKSMPPFTNAKIKTDKVISESKSDIMPYIPPLSPLSITYDGKIIGAQASLTTKNIPKIENSDNSNTTNINQDNPKPKIESQESLNITTANLESNKIMKKSYSATIEERDIQGKMDKAIEDNLKIEGNEMILTSNLFHHRNLSEPYLIAKENMNKRNKKRSHSLNHFTEESKDSLKHNSSIRSSLSSTSPDGSKLKLEETILDSEQEYEQDQDQDQDQVQEQEQEYRKKEPIDKYNTTRSIKNIQVLVSKHHAYVTEKLFSSNSSNQQRTIIPSGGTLTVKKKIKKLRINEWTQPGVGLLLSTLPLDKQCESMKKQYRIVEKELIEHKEIKQPMEELYVFQSTLYQKASNNWKKKYMYLLDEKNKYSLYANILENYMKLDPNEERLFEIVSTSNKRKDSIDYSAVSVEPVTNVVKITTKNDDNNEENLQPDENSAITSKTDIKSLLAKKRQQQLEVMKKTANDLSINSDKLENNIILPSELDVESSVFDDSEYEKELEELADEQERMSNIGY